MNVWLQQNKYAILLAVIMIAGLILRLWGNLFGLPNLYHPDEDVMVMEALQILKTGNWEPIRMDYGTLYFYLLTLVFGLVFLLSARNGHISDTSELNLFVRGTYPAVTQHPEYFLAARTVTAVMGTVLIFMVYLLANRLSHNKLLSLLAASFTAFLPPLVQDAHYATTDTTMLLLITTGVFLILRTYDQWENDTLWAYAGAGFVCGLATSTKYSAALLFIPLIMIPLLRVRRLEDLIRLRVFVGPVGMAVGFLLTSPYALINLPNFLHWFGYELRVYNAGKERALPIWLWHLRYHFTSSHSIAFLLALIGFPLSLYRWRIRGLLVSMMAILTWITLLSNSREIARLWLPSASIFMIWAALSLTEILDWLSHYLHQKNARILKWAVPSFVILFLFFMSAQASWFYAQDDVRTLAQRWIENNVPPGTSLAVDYFGPNLDTNIRPVSKIYHVYDASLEWYEERNIDYMIVSEAITTPDDLSEQDRLKFAHLTDAACLVQTIEGPFISLPGYKIWIYEMKPCSSG